MALWGLGTDIVEIARVEAIVARTGDRLAKRILAPGEWARYQQVQQKGRYLAKRFAVKEAAAKAFGTGFCHGLAFAHFEVEHDPLGKPLLRLHGQAAEMAKERGIQTIHVTLADERQYVCATVIFE